MFHSSFTVFWSKILTMKGDIKMQPFHDELQSLEMDHFQADDMTHWDPDRHHANVKHCASCWSCGSCASCWSCMGHSCWSCAGHSCWSCAGHSCWSCAGHSCWSCAGHCCWSCWHGGM
ncbi:heterocycloanthracin/sonorensin family bacteriocin [Bacillus licheniformis]|uniref:heterocycloanthracin/sonorensin family bacteriocin n=2 Tax=Bacillus licheniformis TaxID=1402 RepID=UPI0033148999